MQTETAKITLNMPNFINFNFEFHFVLSFYSWCNKQRNRHTHRCAESSNASAWTRYGQSWIDWLLPGNLSPRRNLRLMASTYRMGVALCYFDLFFNHENYIEFFFAFGLDFLSKLIPHFLQNPWNCFACDIFVNSF